MMSKSSSREIPKEELERLADCFDGWLLQNLFLECNLKLRSCYSGALIHRISTDLLFLSVTKMNLLAEGHDFFRETFGELKGSYRYDHLLSLIYEMRNDLKLKF